MINSFSQKWKTAHIAQDASISIFIRIGAWIVLMLILAACGSPASPQLAESAVPAEPTAQANEAPQAQLLIQVNAKERDFYLVNADGSGLTRLTQGAQPLYGGAWSPDGERILYVSNKSLESGQVTLEVNPGVYVMKADGAEARLLTPDLDSKHYFAAWSPDGSQIAYIADVRNQGMLIFRMNADGSGQKQLTEGYTSSPQWFPDGQRIVYTEGLEVTGDLELFVIDAGGSQPTQVIGELRGGASHLVSPDGQWIYFSAYFPDTQENDIYRIKPDGSGLENLTNQPGYDQIGDWSPDGQQMVFVSARNGSDEIFIMNADGSNPRSLGQAISQYTIPSWSPDGSKIAFVSNRSGDDQVYVVNIDGSGLVQVSSSEDGRAVALAWRP